MQFLRQNWDDNKGLVCDWLTMTAPIFGVSRHFRQPNAEYTGLVFDENSESWRQSPLILSAKLDFFPTATYTERRLWLLILNHALRGNKFPIDGIIDDNHKLVPKKEITLSLFDVYGVLPFQFTQYKRVKTNNFHIEEIKNAISSITAVCDVLENTVITLPEMGIKFPLLNECSVSAQNVRYPHDVKLTFRLPEWWLNQLLFGYIALPYSLLNMESNIEMKLYEKCVLLNLSPEKPYHIYDWHDFFTTLTDEELTVNDKMKIENILLNNDLVDFCFQILRNEEKVIVHLRENLLAKNVE